MGIDQYLSTHSRLQHAAWCEFLSWRYGVSDSSEDDVLPSMYRKDDGKDKPLPPELQAHIERGYNLPPDMQPTNPEEPYTSPFHQEMKRRYMDMSKPGRKRTAKEQFEIDKTKATWAAHLRDKK